MIAFSFNRLQFVVMTFILPFLLGKQSKGPFPTYYFNSLISFNFCLYPKLHTFTIKLFTKKNRTSINNGLKVEVEEELDYLLTGIRSGYLTKN